MRELVVAAACCVLAAVFCIAQQGGSSKDEEDFKAAYQIETSDGDLQRAISQYEVLARSPDRSVAARSLQRIAAIYEKTGDPRAVPVYQRIVGEFSDQKAVARDASKRLEELTPKGQGAIGWYNGDWQPGIPGLANLFGSKTLFSRVYDDFIVPPGGWTVVAVFSDNSMNFKGVSKASWEIRKEMWPGKGGTLVGAGISRATQSRLRAIPPSRDGLCAYRVRVDGIRVVLSPGRYWVSVTPVGKGVSFANATIGKNAIGSPPANDGLALFSQSATDFVDPATISRGGQFGVATAFSQGVVIETPAR